MVVDRWRDHAEPDAEEALVGDVVLALQLGVGLLVAAGQTPSAERRVAGDPSETGIEAFGPPGLGPDQLLLLLLPIDLLEQ